MKQEKIFLAKCSCVLHDKTCQKLQQQRDFICYSFSYLLIRGSWSESCILFANSGRSHFGILDYRIEGTSLDGSIKEGREYRFRVVVVDSQSFYCKKKAEQVRRNSLRSASTAKTLE